jgi:acetyl esterase
VVSLPRGPRRGGCGEHRLRTRAASALPAPVEQIYDVLQRASSPDRDWDGSELCVGGQSAGGNLAAAAARLALENDGPRVRLQVLHYAPLDLVTPTRDKHTPLGRTAVLRPWMGAVFDTAYIPNPIPGATASFHPLGDPTARAWPASPPHSS